MVETLVSVLISALALMLLATAIGTAVNIVRTSRDSMTDYYRNENDAIKDSQEASGEPTQAGATFSSDVPISSSTITVDVYTKGTITYYTRNTP